MGNSRFFICTLCRDFCHLPRVSEFMSDESNAPRAPHKPTNEPDSVTCSPDTGDRPVRASAARRGARRGLRRSKTLQVRLLSADKIEEAQEIFQAFEQFRPRSRGDCRTAPRPCPWVSCKYHLYLDIVPQSGSIKMNFPDLEVWEMSETCALDVADRGGITLEDVGNLLNLTRERIRQVERSGIDTLRSALGDEDDEDLFDEDDEETLVDTFDDFHSDGTHS